MTEPKEQERATADPTGLYCDECRKKVSCVTYHDGRCLCTACLVESQASKPKKMEVANG